MTSSTKNNVAIYFFLFCPLFATALTMKTVPSQFSYDKVDTNNLNRRGLLRTTAATITGVLTYTGIPQQQQPAVAVESIGTSISGKQPPLLTIGGKDRPVKIPRVGYSLYKTPADQAERCASLALRGGIRYFDVGTLYGSNANVSKALQKYLNIGMEGLDFSGEKEELLDFLDKTKRNGDDQVRRVASATTLGGIASLSSANVLAPPPLGSAGRRGRRNELFISHKLSNDEQSTDISSVKRSVKDQIATLGVGYLDLVSIHSPLTDKSRRLSSYRALLNLRDTKTFVRSVGVCNYGVEALKEIQDANLELPIANQLELSPFNQHKDVVDWCQKNDISICCSAWSRLSGTDGPTEGWSILSELAKKKGMTKAQILVRWSLQKGYVCVPRSSSTSKIERMAIAENSYGGVQEEQYVLTDEEMNILDGLDVGYKAGKLGRKDGWSDTDVTGIDWDPTTFV